MKWIAIFWILALSLGILLMSSCSIETASTIKANKDMAELNERIRVNTAKLNCINILLIQDDNGLLVGFRGSSKEDRRRQVDLWFEQCSKILLQ